MIIRLERRQQTEILQPSPRNLSESAFPVTQILLRFLKGSHSLSPFWQSTRISSYLCSLSPSLFSEPRQRGRQIPTGSFLSYSCTLQETGISYGAEGGGEKGTDNSTHAPRTNTSADNNESAFERRRPSLKLGWLHSTPRPFPRSPRQKCVEDAQVLPELPFSFSP